jgi:arsenate reductase
MMWSESRFALFGIMLWGADHIVNHDTSKASARLHDSSRNDGYGSGELTIPITIYGIPNCDTMKKARAWLAKHGVAYDFHDYKKDGIDRKRLESWCEAVGWETLLNRAGTTFRALPDKDKQGLNEKKAIALMLAQSSIIKRPVLDIGGRLIVGFKAETYAQAFK